MIPVDVVRLPADLKPADLVGHAVVVFDVLRATSTIATALANGATEVRAFGSLEDARSAYAEFDGRKLLAGERQAVRPEGFDLGNSPGEFTAERTGGQTVFLATTNGTRAIVAAAKAQRMFTAALLNATATANKLAEIGLPVTLLCSGTEGQFSFEDFLGAGAVALALRRTAAGQLSDEATEAAALFEKMQAENRLAMEMHETLGGKNLHRANLDRDVEFCARVDLLAVVPEVVGVPPVIRLLALQGQALPHQRC